MRWIAYNFFPIVLVSIAAAMIFKDKPNWGWFLFAAMLIAVFPETKKEKEK